MKISGIDVGDTLKKAEAILSGEEVLSPAVRSLVEQQVFDIQILRMVTEYQAEILEDGNGRQFVAPFPEGVTKAVQYGKEFSRKYRAVSVPWKARNISVASVVISQLAENKP